MKSPPSKTWFNGIDSLRIILALIVLFSHFSDVYVNALKSTHYAVLKYASHFLAYAFDGTATVIAFFIISGFVIHYPNKNGIADIKEFLIRRFLRILVPVAVIFTIGNWFNHPENTVVWSLYCELIFYAIYPLLARIGLSWKSKFLIAYIIAAIIICTMCYHEITAFLIQLNKGYQGYYWQLNGRLTWVIGLPCWLLGVLIAEHIDKLKQPTVRTVIFYRVTVYALSWFFAEAKFHLHLSYILSMNIFALLLYRWLQTEIVYFKTKPASPVLEKMGKFSYSLYLCHPLMYVICKAYIVYNPYTYPLFILITLSCSYGFYLLVERPTRSLIYYITGKFKVVAS